MHRPVIRSQAAQTGDGPPRAGWSGTHRRRNFEDPASTVHVLGPRDSGAGPGELCLHTEVDATSDDWMPEAAGHCHRPRLVAAVLRGYKTARWATLTTSARAVRAGRAGARRARDGAGRSRRGATPAGWWRSSGETVALHVDDDLLDVRAPS